MLKKFKCFVYVFQGFGHAFKTEVNLRIQFIIAFIVIVSSILLEIPKYEWYVIILCIGLVISFELLNTSLERLSDKVEMTNDDLIKQAKDVSAAAVFIVAVCSGIIGLMIFLPRIIRLLL